MRRRIGPSCDGVLVPLALLGHAKGRAGPLVGEVPGVAWAVGVGGVSASDVSHELRAVMLSEHQVHPLFVGRLREWALVVTQKLLGLHAGASGLLADAIDGRLDGVVSAGEVAAIGALEHVVAEGVAGLRARPTRRRSLHQAELELHVPHEGVGGDGRLRAGRDSLQPARRPGPLAALQPGAVGRRMAGGITHGVQGCLQGGGLLLVDALGQLGLQAADGAKHEAADVR
mmetsp:Transcript_45157/g.127475  ORF Transcript_45157/g.127475 Transcript_45157/m.127475 type:complete len:229 (-) Transcript_45157:469-1155(-)